MKSRLMLVKARKLTFFVVASILVATSLSAFGYPNAETIILGNGGLPPERPFYDISLDIPESVEVGDIFEVRLSLEHEGQEVDSSIASLAVTGASLLSEQKQALLPDAVWRIETKEKGTIGIVVSTETNVSNVAADKPEDEKVVYIDTISKKVSSHQPPKVIGVDLSQIELRGSSATRNIVVAIVLVALAVVIVVFALARKRKNR